MTPAQQYAERRSRAVALIETHAPRSQQPLIDLLRPAIALNITRRDAAATTLRRQLAPANSAARPTWLLNSSGRSGTRNCWVFWRRLIWKKSRRSMP